LQNHDVADAARQLAEAPEGLRDWEWHHLHSRLDDSSAVLPLPTPSFTFLSSGPEGLRIGSDSSTGLRLTDETGRQDLALPRSHLAQKIFLAIGKSRGGLWIVDVGEDKTVRLLDGVAKVRMSIDTGMAADPRELAVSPDQTRLAVAWSGR